MPGAEAGALRRLADGAADEAGGLDADLLDGLRRERCGDPGRRAHRHGRAAVRPPSRPSPPRPGPAWPGCRDAPASAVRSTPVCCPGCCPAAARCADPSARDEVAAVWGVDADDLPAEPGLDTAGDGRGRRRSRRGAGRGRRRDRRRPRRPARPPGRGPAGGRCRARRTSPTRRRSSPPSTSVPFLVSLETRPTEVTALADVVLPVAVVTEKAGTFVDWEGRPRRFGAGLPRRPDPHRRAGAGDARRRDGPRASGSRDVAALRAEIAALGAWPGSVEAPDVPAGPSATLPGGRRASWPRGASCSTAARCRRATRTWPPPRDRRSRGLATADAAALGVADGDPVTVTDPAGSVTLPAGGHRHASTASCGCPTNSTGCLVAPGHSAPVRASVVRLTSGGAA